MFLGEPYFSSFFFFYGPLFWYHVRACCRRASDFLLVEVPQAQHSATISPHRAAKQVRADQSATTQASRHTLLQYRKHSTKQRNQPAQSRKASTCRSECDNASKQAELARASTCRRALLQHVEFSKRTKKLKSAGATSIPGIILIRTVVVYEATYSRSRQKTNEQTTIKCCT